MPGSLKVAILLHSMPKPNADEILSVLSEAEREVITGHLSQMGSVAPELRERIAREFIQRAKATGKFGGAPKLSQSISAVLEQGGKQEAEKEKAPAPGSSLEALQAIEPDLLVQLIKDEHPQTIAITLVHLQSEVASEVLARLPDEVKADVALRIANLEKVHSGMVQEINRVFEDILKSREDTVTQMAGGVNRLAEILNQIDANSGDFILEEIDEVNPELAAQIKQLMFVFEDLVLVDDRGLQKVLRRVESKDLAVALKAASEEVRNKIFKNMSSRAAEMLQEEIEAIGSVRMKEVEIAQQTITKIIQDMEEKGELVISGRKGEEFIA